MKFDFERYKKSPQFYDLMRPEDLAFHETLRRCLGLWNGRIEYHAPYRKRSSLLIPLVYISPDGSIHVEAKCTSKAKTARVPIEDVQRAMDCVLEFLTAAFNHGYLLHDADVVLEEGVEE